MSEGSGQVETCCSACAEVRTEGEKLHWNVLHLACVDGLSQVAQLSRTSEICHFPVLAACAVAKAHVSGTFPEQDRRPKGLCVFYVPKAAQRFCFCSGTLPGSPGQQGRVSHSWLQTRISYPPDSMV